MRPLHLFKSGALRAGKLLATPGPKFWVGVIGLAMAGHGATAFHPGAGWLLVGLIVTWDALRDTTPKK